MTQEQVADFLKHPHYLGHLLGLTDLTNLHSEWILKMLNQEKHYALHSHRGSYKSTCVALAIVLLMILYPSRSIAVARKSENDSMRVVREVKSYVESSEIEHLSKALTGKPIKLVKSTNLELITNYKTSKTREGSFTGIFTNTSLTGQHYDIIFFDDITGMTDMYSRAERIKTINTVSELIHNILNRDGVYKLVGTPWHPEDASSIVDIHEIVNCYESGLMSKEEIDDKRKTMPPNLFSINYMLQHSTDGFYLGDLEFANVKHSEYEFALVDKSFGGKDSTALTLIGRRADGKIVVKGKLYDMVEGNYHNIDRETRGLSLYTEDNDDKLKAFGMNKAFSAGKVITYHERENKAHKISDNLYTNKDNLVFSKETDSGYIDQLQGYTTGKNKGFDDAADSLASAIRLLRTRPTIEILSTNINEKEYLHGEEFRHLWTHGEEIDDYEDEFEEAEMLGV